MARGFNTSRRTSIAGKSAWSEKDAQSFVHSISSGSANSFLFEAAVRADGGLRKRLFESSREDLGTDEREAVESATIPLPVSNGAEDSLTDLDYFETASFEDLWDGVEHRLAGLGHVPFWQAADTFNPLFERYFSEMEDM